MTSRRPLASALDKVFPHLLILLCGLGAAVIYDHHWPFRGHGDSPILDLVEHHYPTFYKALTLWHYLPPMVAVLLAGMLLLSVYRVWIAKDGPQAARGALPSWPLSPDDHTWHCDRRDSSPRSGEREQSPRLAYNPRKRSLYRPRDFRGRRIRQDLSLHVSLCPTDFKLAGQKSAAPRGGADSGSQRRFLLFNSEDAY